MSTTVDYGALRAEPIDELSPKDPDAVVRIDFDWSGWLGAGVSIASSTWVVEAGITADSDDSTATGTYIVLSGGTAGVDYTIENSIDTDETPARTDVRSAIVRVRNR